MTDKELLELAAKAAGYEFAWYCEGPNNPRGTPNVPFANGHRWNPLTDDGDAFRLAVRLGMVVQSVCHDEYDSLYAAVWVYDDAVEVCSTRQVYTDDPYAATRRAILRAAAEIGKAIK